MLFLVLLELPPAALLLCAAFHSWRLTLPSWFASIRENSSFFVLDEPLDAEGELLLFEVLPDVPVANAEPQANAASEKATITGFTNCIRLRGLVIGNAGTRQFACNYETCIRRARSLPPQETNGPTVS